MMGVLGYLSGFLGTTEPALRLLVTILIGYPIGILHRKYLYGKEPVVQHLFFTLIGLILGYYNFGWSILHTTINMLVVYCILSCTKCSLKIAVITLIFNMTYLIIGYFVTETDSYDIVWTMPHCILVLRLSGLAFDVFDGTIPENKLSKDSKLLALKKPPSLLELAGYTYFPTSFLVGPQFPMRRYLDFVNGKFSEPNKLPECVQPAIQRATSGFIYLILYTVSSIFYNESYILSDDFMQLSLWRRILDVAIWTRIVLYKYVSCWLICEGSCIMIGLTYNGKDDKDNIKWDGCSNVDINLFESAQNFSQDYIKSFNINTNFWVLQYIYKRLKFLGNKYYSQLGVLLFLSMWHGLHSGYYMSFFMEFLVVAMEKDFQIILERNKTFLQFLSQPIISQINWILLKLYSFLFMGPCVAPLALLSFSKWWQVHKSVYFFTHILWWLWPIYRPLIKKLLPPEKRSD